MRRSFQQILVQGGGNGDRAALYKVLEMMVAASGSHQKPAILLEDTISRTFMRARYSRSAICTALSAAPLSN